MVTTWILYAILWSSYIPGAPLYQGSFPTLQECQRVASVIRSKNVNGSLQFHCVQALETKR